jgi:hypothetical protein
MERRLVVSEAALPDGGAIPGLFMDPPPSVLPANEPKPMDKLKSLSRRRGAR